MLFCFVVIGRYLLVDRGAVMFFFEACGSLIGLTGAYANQGRVATGCVLLRAFRLVCLAVSDDLVRRFDYLLREDNERRT